MILKTKIKPLLSLCRSRWKIEVINHDGAMWIGTGGVIYKVFAMESQNEREVFGLFNISEAERIFWKVCFLTSFKTDWMADQVENEYLIERDFINSDRIEIKRRFEPRMILFNTSNGFLTINKKYFGPLKKYESLQLYERVRKDGRKYLAVKTNGTLIAIILPILLSDGNMFKALSQLGEKCQLELEKLERVNQNDKII